MAGPYKKKPGEVPELQVKRKKKSGPKKPKRSSPKKPKKKGPKKPKKAGTPKTTPLATGRGKAAAESILKMFGVGKEAPLRRTLTDNMPARKITKTKKKKGTQSRTAGGSPQQNM